MSEESLTVNRVILKINFKLESRKKDGGAQVVNFFFFKHGHVAYQINEDDEQSIMHIKFSS